MKRVIQLCAITFALLVIVFTYMKTVARHDFAVVDEVSQDTDLSDLE